MFSSTPSSNPLRSCSDVFLGFFGMLLSPLLRLDAHIVAAEMGLGVHQVIVDRSCVLTVFFASRR